MIFVCIYRASPAFHIAFNYISLRTHFGKLPGSTHPHSGLLRPLGESQSREGEGAQGTASIFPGWAFLSSIAHLGGFGYLHTNIQMENVTLLGAAGSERSSDCLRPPHPA